MRVVASHEEPDQTPVFKSNTSPEYNTDLYVYILGSDKPIRLEVMESRKIGPDRILGFVLVDPRDYVLQDAEGDYLPHENYEKRRDGLQLAVGGQDSHADGVLEYGATFYPCLQPLYLPEEYGGRVYDVSDQGGECPRRSPNKICLTIAKALSAYEKGLVIFKMDLVWFVHPDMSFRIDGRGMRQLSQKSTQNRGITVCFFPITWFDDIVIEVQDSRRRGRRLSLFPHNPLDLLRSTIVSPVFCSQLLLLFTNV